MRQILKYGEIRQFTPEELAGGGLSGEVHLLKHNGKKYILRRCHSTIRAKNYEELSLKFKKYGFLPKFLGRQGKDVLFEYIEGRDLRENENLEVFEQVGRIAGQINKVKIEGKPGKRFYRQLSELVTGDFNYSPKILLKRRVIGKHRKPRPVFSRKESQEIRRVYDYLKEETKAGVALDANDVIPNNFRVYKGKVYFVDIEAIKPRVKGLGIAKCFLKWARTKRRQEAFLKGYSSVSSIKFLTEKYRDFIYMSFLMQTINYNVNIFQTQSYKRSLGRLEEIIEKYKK